MVLPIAVYYLHNLTYLDFNLLQERANDRLKLSFFPTSLAGAKFM